jgi:hypothetical protein
LSSRSTILLVALAGCLAGGCHRTWRADTVQPPLQLGSTTEARTSFAGEILTRDMDFGRDLYLANSAYFVVVSRDRLRFHVRFVHKWKQIADPASWRVWLEDDRGRRFEPDPVDRHHVERATRVEIRSQSNIGQPVWRDTHYERCPCVYKIGGLQQLNSYPLLSLTVWRGDGDYTFYRRDIFRSDLRRLTLVMQRRGYTYRYTWSFGEVAEATTRL